MFERQSNYMANYRRFVTYFYDYSTGNKGGICGFGKIEYSMRSRIHITMQGKRTGREECVVYGISGTEEQPQILGKFMLNYGKGSFLWEWNGKEQSADLFVKNMVGIVICFNYNLKKDSSEVTDNVWAATRWDGVEFQRECFGNETKQDNEWNHVNQSSEMDEAREIIEQKKSDIGMEEKVINKSDKCSDECSEMDSFQLECCEERKENCQEENKMLEGEDSKHCVEEESEESNANSVLQENDMIWNQLCHNYARFMPFPQDSHIQCLKIHIGDLRRFSGENRRLAGNNFLLRGYYRCHYIVLSKWEMEEEAKYYIGIPGIYQEREANLAGHFGFCVFAPFKGGNVANGKCGLWMTPFNLFEEKA